MKGPWRKAVIRVVLAMFVVAGVGLWRGYWGIFPIERQIIWVLPESYSSVKKVETQVWHEGVLITRQEVVTPNGLTADIEQKVSLRNGTYRFLAAIWLDGKSESRMVSWIKRVEEPVVVLR